MKATPRTSDKLAEVGLRPTVWEEGEVRALEFVVQAGQFQDIEGVVDSRVLDKVLHRALEQSGKTKYC